MAAEPVIVIGGGLAGIAATVHLLKRGIPTTLVEQRSFLGGRAYSYRKPEAPPLDNGHHITLGCYENLIQLLQDIGAKDPIRFQKNLTIPYVGSYLDSQMAEEFKTAQLPAPLHLLWGIFNLSFLSTSEKLKALRMGKALRQRERLAKRDMTVVDWLDAYEQPQKVRELLWYPICLGALNRDPKAASAKVLAEVLARAFLNKRRDSSIGLFTRHLSNVHGRQAAKFIDKAGGTLLLGKTASSLELNPQKSGKEIAACLLQDGSRIKASHFISALPHFRLPSLLPEEVLNIWPQAAAFSELGTSPIVNIYLKYARKPVDREFACIMGRTSQWVFDLSHLEEMSHVVSITISDARHLLDTPNEELAKIAHADLRSTFPKQCPDNYEHAWVIKERRATMDHTPENEAERPAVETPFTNFYLAGDWTDTLLPCTLEGAALSGVRAASKVVEKIQSRG